MDRTPVVLLGLHLSLVGGVLMVDTNTSAGGVEVGLLFGGLAVSLVAVLQPATRRGSPGSEG